MHIGAFVEEMEMVAPPGIAEEYDEEKIGLIIEGRKNLKRICCALDVTPNVIKKAVAMRADMLVVHHTPIWNPLTRITGKTAGLLRPLFAADINLYVIHTNFDHAKGGVNDALSNLLALKGISSMSLGNVGTCNLSLRQISDRLSCNLRIWGKLRSVSRLAVVGGSGFDPVLMEEAKDIGATAFLSSEMKHSIARTAPLPCIEATHYALESPAMKVLAAEHGWDYIDDPPVIRSVP
jgi:dinuclear metal center YbgI/SA1388 family protein